MAVHSPATQLAALDISPEALELARQNAERHGAADRIRFFQGDGFAALPQPSSFDLMLANPPYIPTAEIEKLQPEVRDFEPRGALDGGPDGLLFYRRLSAEAAPFLKPGAALMLEFGDGQAEAVRAIFEDQNWIVEKTIADYNHRSRIVIARKPV